MMTKPQAEALTRDSRALREFVDRCYSWERNEISQHDIYEVLKAAAEELERLRDQPPARGTPWL